VAACDPHSEYLPPEEKTNFDISMSGKFEGIGATLQNRNGQTKVVDIIPGSASWRQGDLEVNDIILKVGQGDAEPVDIGNMELDDAVKLIRGKKGSTVKLTVKKINGTIQVIPIVRDVVVIEETYAKSSILTSSDGGTRVGYIYLPKFYVDFNDSNGRRCSRDVKTELQKLASENIDGVILDLRNNGGGSLSDVVDMSGLFIGSGPIVQVKTREGNIHNLDDKDTSVAYRGSMVVLVNNFSASASEILSAALQDYDRAIIMGSQSSFGKGTVQSVIDFDRYVQGHQSIKPLGAIKLTIQKFYRVNGGTTQLKGVIPDIVLPDTYAYMSVGEKESHNALPFDVIPRASYRQWSHLYNKNAVVEASRARIAGNPVFKQIDDNARRLKQRSDKSTYPLNLEAYRQYQKKVQEDADKYGKLDDKKTGVKSTFLAFDKAAAEGDTIKTKKFTKWFEALEKDLYINEAVNVIGDMKADRRPTSY
jgi:carboxyl-terminal processing protease